MSRILIYDRYHTGHHIEFLGYLLDEIETLHDHDTHFALGKESIEILSHKLNDVTTLEIPCDLAADRLIVNEGQWIKSTIQSHKIDKVFFMDIDAYQYILGSNMLRGLGVKVSGILFSPPHRMNLNEVSSWKQKLRLSLKKKRKYLQLRWMLKSGIVSHIFLLDDEKLEPLNKLKHVFNYLPDPIYVDAHRKNKQVSINNKYGIKNGETIVLAFGSIISRKNLEALILSFQYIDDMNIKLLIVGKGSHSYVNHLYQTIERLENNKAKQIVLKNEFVSIDEMNELFSLADFISMTYADFYGSSGILGRAAVFRKKVLASDHGLIKHLVNKYKLGECVSDDPLSISRGIQKLTNHQTTDNMAKYKEYLEYKTPKVFSNTILSILK